MSRLLLRCLPAFSAFRSSRRLLLLRCGLLPWLLAGAAASAQTADLVLNHSDNPDPGPANGVFSYTLRIDNNGPDAASNVRLSDTTPPGSIFLDATPSTGSCTTPALGDVAPLSGASIACAFGGLAATYPSSSVSVVVRLRLPVSGVYTNLASASSDTTDQNLANNTWDQPTTVVDAADLAVAVVPSATAVAAGEAFHYTVSTSNLGPNALPAGGTQVIRFSVPAGAYITELPAGTGWTCTPASGYPLGSGEINCTRPGPLAASASAPDLVVPAVSTVAGNVAATFTVSAVKPDGMPMPDANMDNNTVAVDVLSGAGSDVSLRKTASAAVVAPGADVTFTLTPRHEGGQPPGGSGTGLITVVDTLPAGLVFQSASGLGWSCSEVASVLTCTRPGPFIGGNFTDMPAISVVARSTAVGNFTNQAHVDIPEPDPVPTNNADTVGLGVSNDADLALTKTVDLSPLVVGQQTTFNLAVRNIGPLDVLAGQTLTVTDTLPVGLTLVGTSPFISDGWSCSAAGPTLTCTRSGPVAAGASAGTIALNVTAGAAGLFSNTACVALSGSGPSNPAGANDCGSADVLVTTQQADLAVSKSASGPVKAGENLVYTITVVNLGPDPSTHVTMRDQLDNLVSSAGGVQSVVPSQGACTHPALPANVSSLALVCDLGTLAKDASATVQVTVRPRIAATGPRTNTATVTSPDVGDPDRTNNTASTSSTVSAIVNMVVSKDPRPTAVPVGAPVTYVLTAENKGPSTAQSVRVVDQLPAKAVLISAPVASHGGTCTAPALGTPGGTLDCRWTSLPAGTQYTVTYKLRPLQSALADGELLNAAVVSTTTEETTQADNRADSRVQVLPADLDIVINKRDSADPISLGQMTTYTITMTNAGPSYGTNLVMTDVFPAPGSTPTATFSYQGNLTVSAGGACAQQPTLGATAGTLRCSFPGLDSGASAVVTYQMRAEALLVAGSTSGTAFNAANTAVDETERTMANNQITEQTTTHRASIATDLGITKTTTSTLAVPGRTIDYVLTVTNHGPLASDGAQVVDPLPAGTRFVAGAGCVAAGSGVHCAVGPLAVGASTSFNVSLRLDSPYTGARPLVNRATLDAPGDTDPSNNSSETDTPVGPDPALTSIPTLSPWGLLGLGLLILGVVWRQRAAG
jgi:uncharacterized repeat protein (TIGR01451 family)